MQRQAGPWERDFQVVELVAQPTFGKILPVLPKSVQTVQRLQSALGAVSLPPSALRKKEGSALRPRSKK